MLLRNLRYMPKILCIPAFMGSTFFGKGDPASCKLGQEYREVNVVLANSMPGGCASFVTNRSGQIVGRSPEKCNEIALWNLGDAKLTGGE